MGSAKGRGVPAGVKGGCRRSSEMDSAHHRVTRILPTLHLSQVRLGRWGRGKGGQ